MPNLSARAALRVLAAAALAAAAPLSGGAERSPEPSHVRAELVAEKDAILTGRTISVALKLTMSDGWHTYWLNPGDSGMATSWRWRMPAGFRASKGRWPYPARLAGPRATSYGYSGQASLLFDIQAPAGLPEGTPLELSARVKWLECRQVCVPGQADVSLRLPAQANEHVSNPDVASFFASVRRRIPGRLGVKPFSGWTARALRRAGGIRLVLQPPSGRPAGPKGDAVFFPYEDGIIAHHAPQPARWEGGVLILDLPRAKAPGAAKASRLSGVLVLKARDRALELSIPIEDQQGSGAPS